MKRSEMLSPDEQEEYILIDNTCTNYEALFGWKVGTALKRISVWYGSNGCGRNLKQAYFAPAASNHYLNGQIAWSDHVKEVTGQFEMDF
ncbi:hypothetical protein [Paenibacillus wynnii]|uniref:Uncharacterized protein n=1 Tax=Paenibacillus wynnii TaxID=268407 RepID=A0A098MDF7_9BACL|nr:hypothetical protein [Paenibacillus wynnii]KGE20605.1 hypothetical protein PWYN_15570 [Paenibacillus wynnii]